MALVIAPFREWWSLAMLALRSTNVERVSQSHPSHLGVDASGIRGVPDTGDVPGGRGFEALEDLRRNCARLSVPRGSPYLVDRALQSAEAFRTTPMARGLRSFVCLVATKAVTPARRMSSRYSTVSSKVCQWCRFRFERSGSQTTRLPAVGGCIRSRRQVRWVQNEAVCASGRPASDSLWSMTWTGSPSTGWPQNMHSNRWTSRIGRRITRRLSQATVPSARARMCGFATGCSR